MSERSAAAAVALRESFGDRKVPDISRKITACVTCRKLKIKCHMPQSKPPCTRCKAHNTSCVVNKSLQTLLESDATWKEDMEQRLRKLEQALIDATNEQQSFVVPQTMNAPPRPMPHTHGMQSLSVTAQDSGTDLDLSCSLGAFPASSITDTPSPADSVIAPTWPDLISRGVVSFGRAKELVSFFNEHLDPLIHGAIGESSSLAKVRARSSLLTAAICTVSAFCTGAVEYGSCLSALKDQVSRNLFAENNTFDDVLALCIGAFWLRDVSITLQGLAVRVASQLDLHRCITRMPHTDVACYKRTRLYFLVLLCDHHCSLIYGKPPMTNEWRSLKHPSTLLQNIRSAAASQNATEMQRLNDAYTEWYANWKSALNVEPSSASSASQEHLLDFYFNSGRLFLQSHIFRGQPPVADGPNGSAQDAFHSALSVVKCITRWPEAPRILNKLPSYFSTMLAFACVSLVRAFRQPLGSDQPDARYELSALIDIFRNVPVHRQSLLNFANTLESALSGTQQLADPADDVGAFDMELAMDFDWDAFMNESMSSNLLGDDMSWMFQSNEHDG